MSDRRGTHGVTFDAGATKEKIDEARGRAKELRREAAELDALANELEAEVRSLTDMGKIEERARKLDHALKGSLGGTRGSSDKGSRG